MVAAPEARAHPRAVYRKSAPPASVQEPACGELLVPVGIDALALQLRKSGWPEFGRHSAHVSLTRHRGWLVVAAAARNALFVHPRFRVRLSSEGPSSTRVSLSDPELNPFSLAFAAMPFALMAFMAVAVAFGRAEIHPDDASMLLAGLAFALFFFGVAVVGRRSLGERHAIVAREHLLEQARIAAANSAPRVRAPEGLGGENAEEPLVGRAEARQPRPPASARRR